MDALYRLRIAGLGRYLPERVITNAALEGQLGLPAGTIARTRAGVSTRRWAGPGETNSFMAAAAAREALAEADMAPGQLDLIINGSGTVEQAVPDGGALLQRELGLQSSGIPAYTLHGTCLGFLLGLDVAAAFMRTGRYRRILVASSEAPSRCLNRNDLESACIFGDAAAAAVLLAEDVTHPAPISAIEAIRFETYSEGAELTQIRGGGTRRHPNDPATRPEDNLFEMDGRAVMGLAARYLPRFLGRLDPRLARGDVGHIDWVVPHQPSRLGLALLGRSGFADERVGVTLDHLGNCGAASLPATLYEMVRDGRIARGHRLLLVATGAGLGFGGAIVRW